MPDERELDRVAILGLGLMGGSLGLALRAGGVVREVAGYDTAPGVAERARDRGAVDVACASPAAAVAGARLVVLAAPLLVLRELLLAIGPHLEADAVVTDLGSVKSAVLGWAADLLPDPTRFVGGHPMAGRERSGIEAADAALYRGCAWCLTPAPAASPTAVARVTALVERLGARPFILNAARHDAAVAAVSHLPLVAAAALTLTASARADWSTAQTLAAGGFRDTTRVASGDPALARDICLTNAPPLLDCLDVYLSTLTTLRARVAAGDPTIVDAFAEAQRARDAWLAGRAGL